MTATATTPQFYAAVYPAAHDTSQLIGCGRTPEEAMKASYVLIDEYRLDEGRVTIRPCDAEIYRAVTDLHEPHWIDDGVLIRRMTDAEEDAAGVNAGL